MSRRHRRHQSGMNSSALALVLIGLGVSALLFSGGLFNMLLLIGGIMLLGALFNNGDWAALPRQAQARFTEWMESEQARSDSRSYDRAESWADPFAREAVPQRAAAPQPSAARRAASTKNVSGRTEGQMHRLAVKAVQRAGHDPRDLAVAPVDLGVLVYAEEKTPTLFRELKLPEDARFVRPFVVLRSPRRARGKIRFELVDGQGTRRFVDETPWELQAGETFVYPETWLPSRNIEQFDGEWKLRVSAAGTLLAEHEFEWRDPGGGEFRTYFNGDGEISDDLLQELGHGRVERLSLDALLDDQEGGLIESDPEVEAAARRAEQLNREHNRRL